MAAPAAQRGGMQQFGQGQDAELRYVEAPSASWLNVPEHNYNTETMAGPAESMQPDNLASLMQSGAAGLGFQGGTTFQSGQGQDAGPRTVDPGFVNWLQDNQFKLTGESYTNPKGIGGVTAGISDSSGASRASQSFASDDSGLFAAALGGLGAVAGPAVFGGLGGGSAPAASAGVSGAGAAGDIGFLAANGMTDAAIASAFPELGAAGGLTGVGGGAAAAGAASALESPFEFAQYDPNQFSGLQNVGAQAPGAPAYTTAAADSQLASAAGGFNPASMVPAAGVAPAIPAAAGAAGTTAMAGGLGGGMFASGAPLAGLSGLKDALTGAAGTAGTFLQENPTIGKFVGGAGAALGAGLASQALVGSPPTGPNAGAVIQQQSAANSAAAQEQAQLNRVDTTTPFGFQKFGSTPDASVPGGRRYTQEIGFSPEQQRLYNSETANQQASQDIAGGMQGRVAQSVANPLDLSGAGAAEKALSADRFSADRDKVTTALFERLTRLRKPQMDRDRSALDVQLRNQGLMPGTEAYDNGMRTMLEAQNTDLSNMADQATLAGGAEQSRLQGDSRANSSLNNNVRSQNIQETLLQRQQPLSEFNSFRTGNTPTLPQFQPFGMGSVAPTNTAAAANTQYQSQADAYNARVARLQSLLNFGVSVGKP